ncbi:MAG: hypothetical protein ACREX3_15280 [Gammaproteobacteria bacterium]
MTDLNLTAERRSELLTLLEDGVRLQSEYPKVAEYLDTAPQLSGTGNDEADAAFDLRLIHYMIGGSLMGPNPYWDIVAPSISHDDGSRVIDGGSPAGSPRLAFAQTILQETYAYAVPSPETVRWVSQVCDGRPVIELGAGRGYWAAQLADAGLTVSAYDIEPPDSSENASFKAVGVQPQVWHPVHSLDQFTMDTPAVPENVLLLCWPPGWGDAMASDALAAFEAVGGSRLIYIGEPKGGKTANDEFFAALSARWKLESTDSRYVSWWNLDDRVQRWTRVS